MVTKRGEIKKGCAFAALFVPRTGARRLVAIVYSWWLLKVLSIKWLNYPLGVFK